MGFTQTHIKTFASTSDQTTYTISFGFTATAGRLLVIAWNADDFISGNVTDNLSANWSQATTGSNNSVGYIHYKIAAGGETQVSITLTGSFPLQAAITEWTGNVASSPLDLANAATGNTATATTPSIATTNADDLLIVLFGTDNNATVTFASPGAAWTLDDNTATSGGSPNDYYRTDHQEVTTTGTYSASSAISPSNFPWIALIAAFKAAPAAGGLWPGHAAGVNRGPFFMSGRSATTWAWPVTAGPTPYSATVSDSVGAASDTVARAWAGTRAPSDSVGAASDSVAVQQMLVRSISDSVGPATDTVARAWAGTRAPSESVGPGSDSVVRVSAGIRAPSETVGPGSDTIATRLSATRAPSESVGAASDSVVRAFAGARASTDSVGAASDTVARSFAGARTSSDTIGPAADAVARSFGRPAAPSDSVGAASDTVARAWTGSRGLSESLALSDSVAATKNAGSTTYGETWVYVDGAVKVNASDGDHEFVGGSEKPASGTIWVDGLGV